MSKEQSPAAVGYGTPKATKALKKTGLLGVSPPLAPRREGSRTKAEDRHPPPKQKRPPRKKKTPNLGPGLLAHWATRGSVLMQQRMHAAHGRREYEVLNPRKSGMQLFAGGLPMRVSPDAPEPEPGEREEEQKQEEATQTLGIEAPPQAMKTWELRKKEAITRLEPRIQQLVREHAGWGDSLMRAIDEFAAEKNLGRQGSGLPEMSLKDVVWHFKKQLKPIIDRQVKLWNVRDRPEERPEDHPLPETPPKTPPREPSPPSVAYGSPATTVAYEIPPTPENPHQDLLDAFTGLHVLPDVPDPHQSILPQTATLRIDPKEPPVFGGFGGPEYVEQEIPETPPVFASEEFGGPEHVAQEFETADAPEFEGGFTGPQPDWLKPGYHELPAPPTPPFSEGWHTPVTSPDATPTPSQIMGITPEQSEAMESEERDILGGMSGVSGESPDIADYMTGSSSVNSARQGRNPRSDLLRATNPEYQPGNPEIIQRSLRSVASSFQRARNRTLNVPRGLMKSGSFRGMQVLKKQNFHIEQLSPNELVLHARIINDGVVAQIRGLVAGISRPILVDSQKIPRKKLVNHILAVLESKNHVRITVDS